MKKRKRCNTHSDFYNYNFFSKPQCSNSHLGFGILHSIWSKPKRSQHIVGLPFSVIFSIFLIVVFIVIASIAIKHFLDIGGCAGVGQFYDNFQSRVDEAWVSQSNAFEYKINTASGIKKICFANLSAQITGVQEDYEQIKNYEIYEANLFLLPPEKTCNMPYKLIKHINISAITEESNPYCVSVEENLKIKKDFYDKFVVVE